MRRQNWILAQGIYKKSSHKTVVCCPALHSPENFAKSWQLLLDRHLLCLGENSRQDYSTVIGRKFSFFLFLFLFFFSFFFCCFCFCFVGFVCLVGWFWFCCVLGIENRALHCWENIAEQTQPPSPPFTFRHRFSARCPDWPWTFYNPAKSWLFALLLQSLGELEI